MEAHKGPSKETDLKDEPDMGQEFLTILSFHNFLSLIPDLEKVLKIHNVVSVMLSKLREAASTCLGPSSRAVAGEVETVAAAGPLYPVGMSWKSVAEAVAHGLAPEQWVRQDSGKPSEWSEKARVSAQATVI